MTPHLAIYQHPQNGDKPGYRLFGHFGVLINRYAYLYSDKFTDKDTGLWIGLTREQYDKLYPDVRLRIIGKLRCVAADFVSGEFSYHPTKWANRLRKIAALIQGEDRAQADKFLGIAGMFELCEADVVPGEVWKPDVSLVDTLKAALEW